MNGQINNIDVSNVEYLDGKIKITINSNTKFKSLSLSKKSYDVETKVKFNQRDNLIFINMEENSTVLSVLRGRYVLKGADETETYEFSYDEYNEKQPWLRQLYLGKFSWNPFSIYLVAQSGILQLLFDVNVNVESDLMDFPYTGCINEIHDDENYLYISADFQITRPLAVKNFEISSGLFLVRAAEEKTVNSVYDDVQFNSDTSMYTISAKFLKSDLGSFNQWNFGIKLILNDYGYEYHLKLRRTNKDIYVKVFAISEKNWFESSIRDVVIDPQFMSNGNFMLRVRPKTKLETEYALHNMKLAYEIYSIQNGLKLPKNRSKEGVRLVFERETWFAQDNAFAVFKKSKIENIDNGEMKYVIDSDSPFISNVLKVVDETDILYKYSVEYFYALLTAKELITSIFPLELYSLYKTAGFFVNQIRSIPVYYLGHGLLALKRMTSDYSYNSGLFDRVSVGSTFDYKVHREKLGFGRDNIRKLGYPRWSDLLNSQKSNKNDTKYILYFPTWRPWVDKLSEEEFLESDYFINIQKFINNQKVIDILNKSGYKLIVYLHPNIRRFSKQLDAGKSPFINIITNENVSVEKLEIMSDMIISDYSSVVWDFAIQSKSVIYYQFDQERYIATQGSYIDLKQPIYGQVVTNVEELVNALESCLTKGEKSDISEFMYNSKDSDLLVSKDIMSESLPLKKKVKNMTYDWFVQTWSKKERI